MWYLYETKRKRMDVVVTLKDIGTIIRSTGDSWVVNGATVATVIADAETMWP
jgi:hypothetical protein